MPTIPEHGNCASFWVRGILDAFAAEGLDVDPWLDAAGIVREVLADPDGRLPTEAVSRLWLIAIAEAGPSVGIANAHLARPAVFDVVAYVMMSSSVLFEVLERMARYVRIVSDAGSLELQASTEGPRLVLDTYGGSEQVPWQRMGFSIVTFVAFCRWIIGRELRPVAVEMPGPQMEGLALYEAAFGCPITFGAAKAALVISHQDATTKLPTAHPDLAAVHERVARERLERLSSPGFAPRTRFAIEKLLAEGEPTRAVVARELAVSERTLHRRLAEEGTSFQQLLDRTRRDLADQHIRRDDLSVADIAFLLGFHDQSSFFRAFRRWYGTSPQQHRAKLR